MDGLTNIAALFGVDVNALVLMLSILSAYPAVLFYLFLRRFTLFGSPVYRSCYFLICGLLTLTFAYGANSIHYLVTCLTSYLALKCLSRSTALLVNFTFTFTYLLYGYYITQIDSSYTITWTMAQCVLTLRLISVSFDLYDGRKSKDSEGEKDKGRHTESAITDLPPFYMYLSYCYFPGALFVGPLIPYLSYRNLIIGTNSNNNSKAVSLSVFRLLGGLTTLALFLYGSMYWPIETLQSEDFATSRLWWKLTAMAIVAKIYMYKYVSVWMISEAVCILSGITSGGDGNINLYLHTNVNLTKFEFAQSSTEIIASYNMSTNNFAFKYIYRRLKFLGNIHLSKLITLLFLSVWHGFASGYHFAFSTEFLLLYFEKSLSGAFTSALERYSLNVDYLKPVIWLVGRIYTYYFIGYAFVSFMFLHAQLWWPILSSVYFIGHIFLLSYIAVAFTAKAVMRFF